MSSSEPVCMSGGWFTERPTPLTGLFPQKRRVPDGSVRPHRTPQSPAHSVNRARRTPDDLAQRRRVFQTLRFSQHFGMGGRQSKAPQGLIGPRIFQLENTDTRLLFKPFLYIYLSTNMPSLPFRQNDPMSGPCREPRGIPRV